MASTCDGNVGLPENYVHPYMSDKPLRNIRTKTVVEGGTWHGRVHR